MPADGVLDTDLLAEPGADTHRCWLRPGGTADDVTGVWFEVRDGERVLHEMIKRGGKKGLATACVGGGMGIAMCVERV